MQGNLEAPRRAVAECAWPITSFARRHHWHGHKGREERGVLHMIMDVTYLLRGTFENSDSIPIAQFNCSLAAENQ